MPDMTRTLIVPRQHPSYAGHFPGNPVVPGVLLLHWVCRAVEGVYCGHKVSAINSMKFLAPVRPGDALVVRVSPERTGGRCSVAVARGDEMVARGALRVASEGTF